MNKTMKQPVMTESKPRRKFDGAFKQEAVNSWVASGKPASAVAEELGVDANQLYNWRKKFTPPARVDAGSREELAAENATLRRELERVRQQRDILKKTLGILSETPSNASHASTR